MTWEWDAGSSESQARARSGRLTDSAKASSEYRNGPLALGRFAGELLEWSFAYAAALRVSRIAVASRLPKVLSAAMAARCLARGRVFLSSQL